MAEILDQIRDALEGSIDFEGQRLAEQITTNMLAISGLISFLLGFFTQNIQYTLWSGLAGTALTFLVVVPPWPFFNQKPVKWLTITSSSSSSSSADAAGSGGGAAGKGMGAGMGATMADLGDVRVSVS